MLTENLVFRNCSEFCEALRGAVCQVELFEQILGANCCEYPACEAEVGKGTKVDGVADLVKYLF